MNSILLVCIQKYGLGGREGVGSRPLPPLSLPPLPLSSLLPPLPLEVGPLIQLRLWLWEHCISSPAGSGADPQPKLNLVHFSIKI